MEKERVFLWEYFVDSVSIRNQNAWSWPVRLPGETEFIMFFDPSDKKSGFVFYDADDIVSVLGETYMFEYYLTNKNTDYVICYNHHDVLIACGSAKEWLSKISEHEIDENA